MMARITGVGTELPPDVVTTAEVEERAALQERFGLAPGWLGHVTGVQTRRWASPEVQPSELAAAAGRKALARAGLDPYEVDTLIFAGITRDCLEPATASLVADALGTRNARVFRAAGKLWGTAERYGNTNTTSLALAMAEAEAAGRLIAGAKVLVLAPSSGVSAAALTMVW